MVPVALIPMGSRIIFYLALSLSQLVLARHARTFHGSLSPLRSPLHNSTSFTDPQTLRCYTIEEAGFPVDKRVCAPVIKSIYDMRESSRVHLMKGIACPIVFDVAGTPCQITLVANTPYDEDTFSKRTVAQVAMKILDECDREKFGGIGILGTKGFAVRVDTPFAGRIRPLRTGRHVLKEF